MPYILNLKKQIFESYLIFPCFKYSISRFSNSPRINIFIHKAPSFEDVDQVEPGFKNLFEFELVHFIVYVKLEISVLLLVLDVNSPVFDHIFGQNGT
jgi:hypothetical protein